MIGRVNMRVCPKCGTVDSFGEEEVSVEDYWCDSCLREPITAMLDELAKIRPQRPA
jgi:hypothetical protein